MKLEEQLKDYKEQMSGTVREEKILETIRKSQDVYILREQEQSLSYLEFVTGQFRLIRKRWWLLQFLLLEIAAMILPYMKDKAYVSRALGVIGVLFVVLVIPEFWKNKSCGCMQVEGACLYSLRQIYAARMFLFGIVDVFLLTCFCGMVGGKIRLAFAEILVQFLFSTAVAACICFGTLCSNTAVNEAAAILFCLLWSGIWWIFIMNETIYAMITFPVWCALFGMALIFLAGVVYKTIHDCNGCWEVDLSGNANN